MKPKLLQFNHQIDYWSASSKEDVRHNNVMKCLKAALKELQGRCPHKKTTFYSDPAGGNDSYYRCENCDKAL